MQHDQQNLKIHCSSVVHCSKQTIPVLDKKVV